MKIVIMGNAGAGKSTMARQLIGDRTIPRLSLDEIAWQDGPERKPLNESIAELHCFVNQHDEWIIEGCYGNLLEAALPFCHELRFLNPGIDACVEHCQRRPWEPEKFATPDEQNAMLENLIAWVQEYETRDDEYGLKRHRHIFDGFTGCKTEYTSVVTYDD